MFILALTFTYWYPRGLASLQNSLLFNKFKELRATLWINCYCVFRQRQKDSSDGWCRVGLCGCLYRSAACGCRLHEEETQGHPVSRHTNSCLSSPLTSCKAILEPRGCFRQIAERSMKQIFISEIIDQIHSCLSYKL